jgi:Transposase DDE domain
MFESHHVSRHFEKRCKQSQRQARKQQQQADAKERQAQKKAAKAQANRRRAQVVKRLPKHSLAVHAASHLILAARATTGMGADHPHFVPLLDKACTRMSVAVALADAGYDSEANHQTARQVLGVRSLIPATIGRPGAAGPTGHYRRLMRRQLKAGPDKKCFGQRWQAQTVNSMVKRNLGSACRSRTPRGRKKDMLLRVVTHNVMILANL